MPSATLDLSESFVIEQNADFIRSFQINNEEGEPYDLTGAVLIAHVKRPLQRGTPNAAFTVTIHEPRTSGSGFLSLTELQTLALNTREPYVWDILMVKEGVSTRLIMGDVIVSPAVATIDGSIIYYGKSALSGVDMDSEAEIIAALSGLAILAIGATDSASYPSSVPTPKFLYYAYPASRGVLVSAMINGFESLGDFEAPETIDFSGEDYLVYRSTNALQGAYTVEFS